MTISSNKSYEYVWVKQNPETKTFVQDSMQIIDPYFALGNSTLVAQKIGENHNYNQNWQMATISMVMICVYSYIIFRFFRPIKQLLKTNLSITSTLANIYNPSRDFYQFLKISKPVAVYCLAITLMLTLKKFNLLNNINEFNAMAAIAICIILIYWVRMTIIKIAGNVTQTKWFFDTTSFIHTSDIALMTVVMTPIAILLPFVEQLYYVAVYAIGTIFVYMIVRIYLSFNGEKISFMQWFLYLCGVEITPVLVVIVSVIVVNNSVFKII